MTKREKILIDALEVREEDEAIAFAKWILRSMFRHYDETRWISRKNDDYLTTEQLYNKYKNG